jgi:hypothetical protein
MTNSCHQQYRLQLKHLETDRAILAALGTQARLGWSLSGRNWRRIFGRFHPDQPAFATLVYEAQGQPQTLLHVEVFATCPNGQDKQASVMSHPELGWIRAKRFPDDAVLSTLASVLEREPDSLVLRYRPRRRCTLSSAGNCGRRIIKVYPARFAKEGRGDQIHSASIALWEAAARKQLKFNVAKPEAWDARLCTISQTHLNGVSLRAELLNANSTALAQRLGEAAASLTVCEVAPRRLFDRGQQLADSHRYAREIVWRIPALAEAVGALLDVLAEAHSRLPQRRLRPIHGDMDAGQWLMDGSEIFLLDFDDFALGEPEIDVATFVNELEIEEHGRSLAAILTQAFIRGYQETAGSLDHELLGTYLAHKKLFRSLTLARALRSDGAQQAAKLINAAFDCIRNGQDDRRWKIAPAIPCFVN